MEEKFLKHIGEALEIGDRPISLADTFRDYDEWDSLGRLSMIAMLDEEYGVAIEESVFDSLLTLQDLYIEVNKRREQEAAD